MGRVRAVSRLCEFYPGICLTTEKKLWKYLYIYIYIYRPIKYNSYKDNVQANNEKGKFNPETS